MKAAVAVIAIVLVAVLAMLAAVQMLRFYVSALRGTGMRSDDWDAKRGQLEDARRRSLHNLHEVQFDFDTGKIDDKDYAVLRTRYTQRAVVAMNALDAMAHAEPPDVAEQADTPQQADVSEQPDGVNP